MNRKRRGMRLQTSLERLEERLVLSNWNGTIPDGTVWAAGEVQVINGDVTVPAGSKLTIQPGAIIKLDVYYREFTVDGTVLAQGTQANPIIFTEIRDDVGGDTNGDGSNSSPANGNWDALRFNPDSTGSILDHVILRYGGHYGAGEIIVNGGELTLTNSTVANSSSSGLRIQTSNPTLTNNIYQNNSDSAISMDLASNPAISGVTVTNNGTNGLKLDSGTLVGNGFWDDPDIVYWQTEDITVPQGSTLMIGAGQIVKRDYFMDLIVQGTLNAMGTAAKPIVFTERRDDTAGGDTNNDSSNSTAALGGGGTINLTSTSTANVMDHVEIRYSGHYDEALLVNGAPLTFTNGVVRDSGTNGLRIQSSNPTVTGTTFSDNQFAAISMDLASNPVLTALTTTGNGVNGVVLDSGVLAVNSFWTNPGIVYWQNDDITVPAGLTLTIGPGQVIKHPYYGDLIVNGTLNAVGTSAAPIIFTDRRDDLSGGDTNNDGTQSSPDYGGGGTIGFYSTSTANVMDHVQILYSGHYNESLVVSSAPLTFTNGAIRTSATIGLRIESSSPTVTGTEFSNNLGAAVSMNLASNPVLTGNTVTANGINAVVLDGGTATVNLTWNNPEIVYWMNDDITIPSGLTLAIAAGQVIKRPYYGDLFVLGSLQAIGTTAAPIIFTDTRDDTAGGDSNNDQNNSNPSSGNAGIIDFKSGSTANFMDHVEVRYAGYQAEAILDEGAPFSFTNGVIRDSSTLGLRIQASTATVTGNTFLRNSYGAMSMDLASQPTINGNTFTGNGVNGLVLDSGTITANTTWNNPSVVYWLSDDVTVAPGVSLTIAAGQVVKRPYYADLFVDGTLNAVGTVAAPIVFTERRDDTAGGDTNNDGSNSGPDRNNSGMIRFSTTSTGNQLSYVEIRYAGNDGPAILDDNAPLTLSHSVIRDTSRTGLRIQSSNAVVADNSFIHNAQSAISADLNANLVISGNTLTNNDINGITLDSGTLTQDTSWNNPDIVYWLTDDVTVAAGVTLNIGPGQIIKRPYYVDLLVNGTLNATGVAAAPIVFTETHDDSIGGDTNNDQANSTPSQGNTGTILFSANSSGNVLDHVEIRYAGYDTPAAVQVDGGDLAASNLIIRNSSSDAVLVRNQATVSLDNSLLVHNSDTALRSETGALITAANNTVDGNTRGVSVDGAGSKVMLTNSLVTNQSHFGISASSRGVIETHFDDIFNPSASSGNFNGGTSVTGQDGNISVDPLYVDRANLDYHLQATSPAIDAGTSNQAPVDDLDFNLRVDNSTVPNTGAGSAPFFDLGAYEFGGIPRALKSDPTGNVSDIVSQVVFTFRGGMDTTSFSVADDVISFTGPGGPIAVTGFQWLNKYQLAVKFATQAKAGTYQMVLGPNILNQNETALDTDGDGTAGETVDDRYTAAWTIVSPRVIRQSPDDYTSPPIDHIDFTFDRPMDQTSFDLSDIVNFTGPNGNLTATGFTWFDPRTLRISLPSQSTLGAYHIVLGPNIRDIGGNLLDQNGDGVAGQIPSDNETADFTLANIFHVSGEITQNTTWGGLIIVDDNVQVDPGVTLTINPGTTVKFSDATGITVQAGAILNASGTTAQPIYLTSIHDDTVSGDSDHNGDRITAQPGDWSQVLNSGTATFDHVQVLYGSGIGNTGLNSGAIRNSGGSITFSNSLIRDAFYDGLDSVGGPVTVSNSVITGADRGLVATFSGAVISIVNSTLDNNRIAVFAHAGGSISVTNSIVSNSLQIGIDTDSGPQQVTYSDVYSTIPNAARYSGMTDVTGTNGNISADPRYVSGSGENYRLKIGSPAIDAANGVTAPSTDQAGSPRYDDPRTANTGTVTANNAFADMGAYEFTDGAPSNLDLIVTSVSSVATAVEGDKVTVNWTTKNVGTGVAAGTWNDSIYLSTDPVWSPDDAILGSALHLGDLGANQSYSGSADVTVPGVLTGSYYILVRANSDSGAFEGQNQTNNVTASSSTISLDVPLLTLGASQSGQLVTTGDSRIYKLRVPQGNDVKITLNGPDGPVNELYATLGNIPTRQSFDVRGSLPNQADQSIILSGATGGTYYILVYGATVPVVETFTLLAATSDYSLASVSPAAGTNTGPVTVTITGANFNGNSHPQLVDGANQIIQPTQIYFENSSTLVATFDLAGRSIGQVDVQVIANNNAATLPHGFNIISGHPGRLVTSVSTPSAVRVGRNYVVYVNYANEGDSDIPAPVMLLQGLDTSGISLYPDLHDASSSVDLIGINPDGPAGILSPGAQGRIPLYVHATTGGTDHFQLSIADYSNDAIDWSSINSLIRPVGVADADWNQLFTQLQTNIGDTWDDFAQTIAHDATLYPPSLGVNYSFEDVFQLEVARAEKALVPCVSGQLSLNDSAHPLGNVVIHLNDPVSGLAFTGVSLLDGSFLIPDVAPGTYNVTFGGFIPLSSAPVVIGNGSVSGLSLIAGPAGAIAGTVVLSPSGIPQAGVLVTATADDGTQYTATTGDDGSYVIDSLPSGNYDVVTGSHTLTNDAIQGVAVTSGETEQHVNFALTEGAVISGTVTTSHGPVAGAIVTAFASDGSAFTSLTDANGQYVLAGLPAGSISIRASESTSVASDPQTATLSAGEELSAVNFVLAPAGSLTGRITLQDGTTPAPNVTVTLQQGQTVFSVPNEVDGTFSVTGLPPGDYTLTTTSSTLKSVSNTVHITAGQNSSINLTTVPLANVSGNVENSLTGAAIANVFVYAVDASGQSQSTLTDHLGHYELDGLDVGTYQVVLGDPGTPGIARQQITIGFSTVSQIVDLNAPISGVLTGTVFSADGTTPLANASVTLVSQGQSVLSMSTDDAGHYTFDIVADGTYSLRANASGAVYPTIDAIAVNGGVQRTGLDFRPGSKSITGTVQDQANGNALAGARVTVSRIEADSTRVVVATVVTSEDGSFALTGVPPGSYQVTVNDELYGYVTQVISITSGSNAPLVFNLTAEATLVGTVRDAVSGSPLASATLHLANIDDPLATAVTVTDDSGHYRLAGLPTGTYRLLVQDAGKASLQTGNIGMTSGQGSTFDVQLNVASTMVSGTVSGAIGPIAGSLVIVRDAAGTIWATTITGADGKYSIGTLPSGSYSITASVPGYLDSPVAQLTLAAGQTVQNLNLVLAAAAITDADSPPAAAGALDPNWRNEINGEPVKPASDQPTVQQINTLAGDNGDPDVLSLKAAAIEKANQAQKAFDELQAAQNAAKASLAADHDGPFSFTDFIRIYPQKFNDDANRLQSESDGGFSFSVNGEDYDSQSIATNLKLFSHQLVDLDNKLYEGDMDGALHLLSSMDRNFEVQFQALKQYLNSDYLSNPSLLMLSSSLESITDNVLGKLNTMKNSVYGAFDVSIGFVPGHTTLLDGLRFIVDQIRRFVQAKRDYNEAVAAAKDALAELNNKLHPDHKLPVRPKPIGGVKPTGSGQKPPPDSAPGSKPGGTAGAPKKNGGDPNDKIGPAGFGPSGFIQPGAMSYEVEFENSASAGANAPAQKVVVTDTLDADVDVTTVQFTGFGFGSHSVTIPAGLQHFQTTIDLRPEEIDLLVHVELDFDAQTRILTAEFQSLDPVTGLPTEDPNAGFLPVNDATNVGVGYITYTVQPKAGLSSGTAITNQASIVFDTNAAIATPTTLNTLDDSGPTSHVVALPATEGSASFPVTWTGSDEAGGSGIATYDIYVSDNGGDFSLWQSATALTSANYTGTTGHTYAFYSVATDNVGHLESKSATAEATTLIVPNSPPVIDDQTLSVPENSVLNTVVGSVLATDPNVGDTLTYSITSGNELGAFAINAQTGQMTVANVALLDFEAHPSWPLVIQVSDNHGATDSATVTVNLTNVNEPPTITAKSFSIAENTANTTTVGADLGTDPDTADTLTYSITGGNASGAFAINAQTGVITVANSSQLDFETHPTFNLTVQVMDNHGATGTGTVTVNLTDVNDTPQLILNGSAVTFSAKAAKKSGPVHVAPNVTVVDPDQSPANSVGGGTLTFNIDVSAKVSKKGKVTLYDTIGGLSWTSLGTVTGSTVGNNKLMLTIHLNAGTTAAAIQSFLRGITFTSKGTGLKLAHRTLTAQLSDAAGASSNVLTQTINVTK